jgi:hypothetical protein
MNRTFHALATLVAATTITTGCGGGGDGDDPPSIAAMPLAITADTAARIGTLVPGVGDAVLTAAQFAVDATRRFALPGTLSPVISTCPNSGLLTVTLVDRDGDGVASAGDRISVDARDCAAPILADMVAGTMHIDLSLPTGLPATSLRAAVTLATPVRVGEADTDAPRLLGSMQLDWSSTGVQTVLRVTASAADDLRVMEPGTGANPAPSTAAIRQPELTKTLQFDQARSAVSMSFRYESEALAGSVSVATPAPLQAYLNTFPEDGRVEVAGAAGSKVVLTPNFASNSHQYQYAFDSNGDGQPDANGSLFWGDSLAGYLWWDGTTILPYWSGLPYGTRPFATTDFFANASLDWTTASASAVRLQFSRLPASTTPALFFRFVDRGPSGGGYTPPVIIAATAQVHGALIIVKPITPLRHARSYTLQASGDGVNWSNNVTVQDALGNSSSDFEWGGMSFTTPDNLLAVAVAQAGLLAGPGEQVSLSGQGSTGAPRPIVSYRWSQVSGTPLRFADATAAQTTVSWGDAAPAGVEAAVVRLTVADAAGDTEWADLTVTSADLSSATHLLYFRSAAGDQVGAGAISLLANSQAQFQSSGNFGWFDATATTPGSAQWWNLYLRSADGLPLHVGAYENATWWPNFGQNGISFSVDGRSCGQTVGRFDVLEIETDFFGTVTKLAIDFEQRCGSGAPPLLGSYRVNSGVPIRR